MAAATYRDHEQCLEHTGTCARMNSVESMIEKQIGNGGINEQLWKSIDKMNTKLNVLLGGVLLLWPVVQLLVQIWSRQR